MPVLPGSLALITIPDGSPVIASNLRTNYLSIQGAVNGLISILDDGNSIDGDPLIWDATLNKWSAASRLAAGRPRPPRVFVANLSGGPPASPLDGDIWIAPLNDGTGTVWQFRYNAGSAASAKWELIGGVPWQGQNGSSFAMTGTGTWQAIPGESWTAARGGDYLFRGYCTGNAGPGLLFQLSIYDVTATTVVDAFAYYQNTNYFSVGGAWKVASVAAGHVYAMYMYSSAAQNHLGSSFEILPIRVA